MTRRPPPLRPPLLRPPVPGRRRFLRGLVAGSLVTVGLPWLELFAGRKAYGATLCDDGFPRRLVVFLWGNGNRPELWTPAVTGPDYELPPELESLAPVRSKLSVVTGLSTKVDNISPHWSGAAGLLTGAQVVGTDDDWTVAGPTIDQVVAEAVGGETLYRSIQVGVDSTSCFSFAGPNAQNPAENDPAALYARLFGDSFIEPGKKGTVPPSLGWRRSALDAVMEDARALQGELGAADQERLERHLDGLRDLEARLQRLQEDPPDLAACERPLEPDASYPEVDGRPQLSAISRVMADMVAMSLACDQTRVVTFQFSPPLSNALYPDAPDGHHNLTHDEGEGQPTVDSITRYIVGELAYLLQAMDAVTEGDGTLLDHSLVLGASEVSEGRTHSLDEVPLLVAGGGCGRLVTGEHVRSNGQESSSKAMLSVLRAMDLNLASWGEDECETSDGFSALEVS